MRILVLACLALVPASAQSPHYEVGPDSAVAGIPRRLEITALAPTTLSFSNCFYSTFHLNDAARSLTFQFGFASICSQPGPTLNAGQSVSVSFNVPVGVTPGTYWLKCQYNQGGSNFITEWVDFRVEGAREAQLTAPPATWNSTWNAALESAQDPGGLYVAAACLEQTQRIGLGPDFLSLQQDALLALSYPNPSPLFVNFGLGALDNLGQATLGVNLPAVPPGFLFSFHVQAVIIPLLNPNDPPRISNCIQVLVR